LCRWVNGPPPGTDAHDPLLLTGRSAGRTADHTHWPNWRSDFRVIHRRAWFRRVEVFPEFRWNWARWNWARWNWARWNWG
jgi:hypothetical protein